MKQWLGRIFLLGLLSMSAVSITFAETTSEPGEPLAVACAACHGADGNSVIPSNPSIAGQNQKYFIEQMNLFIKGNQGGRDNPIMHAIAMGLSAEQIKQLADYFAQQKAKIGAADPQYVPLGQRIYQGGIRDQQIPACAACHGPKGEGNQESGFPSLQGQHAAYTIAQLEAYKKGSRQGDVNGMMTGVAKQLSKEDMQAVASYLQGLH